MRKLIWTIALLVMSAMVGQAQTTLNFTNSAPHACQTATTFCQGYNYDDLTEGKTADEWIFSIHLGIGGTFSGGSFTEFADIDSPDTGQNLYFTASNFTGSVIGNVISGTFSGTLADGRTFSGSMSMTYGQVRLCAGKYGCHMVPGVVSGTTTITVN